MATSSGTAAARARPAARPRADARPAPRRRAAERPDLLGGVLWIVVFGVLLAGVVALNVAVLELNVRLDRAARERADLRAANAALAAQVSSAQSTPQIEQLARRRLGLVPAAPEQTEYVELSPR